MTKMMIEKKMKDKINTYQIPQEITLAKGTVNFWPTGSILQRHVEEREKKKR